MAAAQKSNKKRPATSQSGPTPKKAHLEKAKSEKKRSRPITLPVREAASASDSEGDQDDLDVGAEDDWVDEDDAAGDAMDEDTPAAPISNLPPKDPNGTPSMCIITVYCFDKKQQSAARESHKAQKLLQDQRRAAKPHSTLVVDAKRVWSLARQKNIKPAERQKHIAELMGVIQGRVKDIVFKHDASRIVQTVVKHGGQKERDVIAVELKGKFKELAQNKYSKVRESGPPSMFCDIDIISSSW